MDPVLLSIQEYIKSGEYFIDARKWYNLKYLYPVFMLLDIFSYLFYNFMNIDNQLSPIMLYQKTFKRFINILSTTYNKDEEVVVKFESLAKNINEEIIENMVWQATIGFDIDQINLNLAINSKFNFVVTSYKLKLLENKLENKNNK